MKCANILVGDAQYEGLDTGKENFELSFFPSFSAKAYVPTPTRSETTSETLPRGSPASNTVAPSSGAVSRITETCKALSDAEVLEVSIFFVNGEFLRVDPEDGLLGE